MQHFWDFHLLVHFATFLFWFNLWENRILSQHFIFPCFLSEHFHCKIKYTFSFLPLLGKYEDAINLLQKLEDIKYTPAVVSLITFYFVLWKTWPNKNEIQTFLDIYIIDILRKMFNFKIFWKKVEDHFSLYCVFCFSLKARQRLPGNKLVY